MQKHTKTGPVGNQYGKPVRHKCLFGTVPARHVLQCLLGTSYSACSARPTVPSCSACSAHLPTSACSALKCLLGTPKFLLGTPKCLLGTAHPPAPAPDPRSASPGFPPHTHGSLTGNEKNSGVWGVHVRHNQAKPCNTMQNHVMPKSSNAKNVQKRALLRSVHTCTPCSNSVFFNAKPCETRLELLPLSPSCLTRLEVH